MPNWVHQCFTPNMKIERNLVRSFVHSIMVQVCKISLSVSQKVFSFYVSNTLCSFLQVPPRNLRHKMTQSPRIKTGTMVRKLLQQKENLKSDVPSEQHHSDSGMVCIRTPFRASLILPHLPSRGSWAQNQVRNCIPEGNSTLTIINSSHLPCAS